MQIEHMSSVFDVIWANGDQVSASPLSTVIRAHTYAEGVTFSRTVCQRSSGVGHICPGHFGYGPFAR